MLLFCAAGNLYAQQNNLLDRVSNKRMVAFEKELTRNISATLSRYLSSSQYVLSVRIIWNRDLVSTTTNAGIAPTKQKLPGFPIFVTPPGQEDSSPATPSFVRMVVKVLLDETLPEYYERFIRKIVPVVARFDASRGDQVIVLKETFPVKQKQETPPTAPFSEEELMGKLPPEPLSALPKQSPSGQSAFDKTADPLSQVRLAYEEERYQDALVITRQGFRDAKNHPERSAFLAMEGSILYTLNDREGAVTSWRRALVYNPVNLEVQRALRFVKRSTNL